MNFEKNLLFKVSNEYKHCLKNFNPYNLYDTDRRFLIFLDDYNNYCTF